MIWLALGASMGQGFLLGRPITADDLQLRLRSKVSLGDVRQCRAGARGAEVLDRR